MKITTCVKEINQAQAMSYLELLYDHQRPLSQPHVNFLANAMKSGEFDPTAQVALASLNGRDVLINGQHTLWAIVESDTKQTLPVISYAVGGDDDIARLYSHFDIGRSRNFADAVRAFNVSEGTGLKCREINALGAALRYMLSGFPRSRPDVKFTNEKVIEEIYNWQDQAVLFLGSVQPGDVDMKLRLSRSAVMSVFLVILKYHPDKGADFTRQVAIDDGLRVGDPRKALNKYLRSTCTDDRRAGLRRQQNGQFSRAVAKCWGKFLLGASLKNVNIKPDDVGKSIVIVGTPYDRLPTQPYEKEEG